MRKLILTFGVLFALAAFNSSLFAQTRLGTTVKTIDGNGNTFFTCPHTSNSVCQTWETNADGSFYCIVRYFNPSGNLEIIEFNVKVWNPTNPPAPDGIGSTYYRIRNRE